MRFLHSSANIHPPPTPLVGVFLFGRESSSLVRLCVHIWRLNGKVFVLHYSLFLCLSFHSDTHIKALTTPSFRSTTTTTVDLFSFQNSSPIHSQHKVALSRVISLLQLLCCCCTLVALQVSFRYFLFCDGMKEENLILFHLLWHLLSL